MRTVRSGSESVWGIAKWPWAFCPAFALLSILVILEMSSGCTAKSKANTAVPAVPVRVVRAIQQDVPIYGDWVATLDGYVNAQIQPQVSGYLVKQLYREGSHVHKGEVLFEIDPRTFIAALDQAKGQLAEAEAKLSLAEVNVKRDTPLAKQRAISQSQLDTEIATQLAAKANVQSAQAAVEQADLNLKFTKVQSLIDGIAGIATVQMGNLVTPSAVLTTISKVDPIKVYFPISEQEYLKMAAQPAQSKKAGMNLDLILSDGSTFPHKGSVVFTDRQVDPQTGTIRIVGAFPNPGNVLRPGGFGRIHSLLSTQHDAVLIPQHAVIEVQGSYQVAMVNANNTITMRKIKPGARVGNMWVIDEGLKAGETVVEEGMMKVRDGVIVNPTMRSDNSVGGK